MDIQSGIGISPKYDPFPNGGGALPSGIGMALPAPPKLMNIKMLSGFNPFGQGDIIILAGKGWVITGFSSGSSDPITTVHLKEVL